MAVNVLIYGAIVAAKRFKVHVLVGLSISLLTSASTSTHVHLFALYLSLSALTPCSSSFLKFISASTSNSHHHHDNNHNNHNNVAEPARGGCWEPPDVLFFCARAKETPRKPATRLS